MWVDHCLLFERLFFLGYDLPPADSIQIFPERGYDFRLYYHAGDLPDLISSFLFCARLLSVPDGSMACCLSCDHCLLPD